MTDLEELLPPAIAQAIAAARREGAEEMRERAAKFVEWWLRPDEARYLAQDIRALPLTPEEPPTTNSTPDPPPAAKAQPE